jgi:O-antigen ligase
MIEILPTTNDIITKEIIFFIPKEEWVNLLWIQLYFIQEDSEICMREIQIKNTVQVSGNEMYDAITGSGNIYETVRLVDNQCCLIANDDGLSTVAFSPLTFYNSNPIGFQYLFRLFFVGSLFLFLLFFLYSHTFSQFLPIMGIGIFLITLPLKISYNTWGMIIMALTIIIYYIKNRPRNLTWHPIFYILSGLFFLNIIGLIYTSDFQNGIKRLDTTIPFVLFPFLFSIVSFSTKNVMLLLRLFIWIIIAFCGFGLLSYITIIPEFDWNTLYRDSKLYASILLIWPAHAHPSYFSTIIIMAIPIAFYLRFQDKKEITIVELCLGVLLPVIFTVLTGARIGLVIIPFLLFFAYFFYCRLKPILKWGLVGLGVIILCLFIYKFPKVDDRFQDPIRKDLRTIAVEAIKEKPILGWGTRYVSPLIRSEDTKELLGIETPYSFNQFHNQYLENMVQFGIPGILILLLLFGWMLYLSIRYKDYLLLSLLTIYVLFFWTESALFTFKGIVPFTFWLCFLVATQKQRLGDRNEKLNEQVNQ